MARYKKVLVTGAGAVLGHGFKAVQDEYPDVTFVFLASRDCDLRDPDKTMAVFAAHQPDAVIHLAAVSDYAVASVEIDGEVAAGTGKIPSGHGVVIRLRPNPKLIDDLKSWSVNPAIRVVGASMDRAPVMFHSLRAGEPIEMEEEETLGTGRPRGTVEKVRPPGAARPGSGRVG